MENLLPNREYWPQSYDVWGNQHKYWMQHTRNEQNVHWHGNSRDWGWKCVTGFFGVVVRIGPRFTSSILFNNNKKRFLVLVLHKWDSNLSHGDCKRNGVKVMTNNVFFLPVHSSLCKGKELALPEMSSTTGDQSFPVAGFEPLQFPIQVCFSISTKKQQDNLSSKWVEKVFVKTNLCMVHSMLCC